MAAFSRGIRPLLRPPGYFYVCSQCRRALATSPSLRAGHNRWSKIRHQKGAADAKKTAVISQFTKSLTLYSKRELRPSSPDVPEAQLLTG